MHEVNIAQLLVVNNKSVNENVLRLFFFVCFVLFNNAYISLACTSSHDTKKSK